jgi:predicted MFS family arabinose efflux permease
MFWLSRVNQHSHYLTGVGLPLILFAAAAAGLIFVPLTMTLVAGIADEHSGVASSMFNAGQQIGGAVGLAVIGSVAWTAVNRHVRDSLSHLAAGHTLAGPAAGPGSPIYDHALSSGVTTALTMGAAATVLALLVTVIAVRVRREDLPDSPPAI